MRTKSTHLKLLALRAVTGALFILRTIHDPLSMSVEILEEAVDRSDICIGRCGLTTHLTTYYLALILLELRDQVLVLETLD